LPEPATATLKLPAWTAAKLAATSGVTHKSERLLEADHFSGQSIRI
jgi:hypothetical protein